MCKVWGDRVVVAGAQCVRMSPVGCGAGEVGGGWIREASVGCAKMSGLYSASRRAT